MAKTAPTAAINPVRTRVDFIVFSRKENEAGATPSAKEIAEPWYSGVAGQN
jgi:hypothetical protein